MATFQLSSARPWYLSLTAKWEDANENEFLELQRVLAEHMDHIPVHHVSVPKSSLHSTVFAILKINDKPIDFDSASDYAMNLFTKLRKTTGLVNNIRRAFQRDFQSFRVTARELKCFDDCTTVQFKAYKRLQKFRDSVRPFFEPPVEALIMESACNSPFLKSLLCDPKKSRGAKFFGSVARSPSKWDTSFLRWKESLPNTTLTFTQIHLLVSDDALTNPLWPEKNDIVISCTHRKRRGGS